MKGKQSLLMFAGLVLLAFALPFAMVFIFLREKSPPISGEGGSPSWEFPPGWFLHSDDDQRAAHSALLGKPMPPLDLSDWQNGQIKPEDLKGKVVVIDFWATWCEPCLAAFPDNETLYEKYHDKGMEFIGVCAGEGQDGFEKIVQDKQIKYPVARDASDKTATAWRVMWFPTYAVIDRKGNLRAIGLAHEYVEQVVQKLLAEPAT